MLHILQKLKSLGNQSLRFYKKKISCKTVRIGKLHLYKGIIYE